MRSLDLRVAVPAALQTSLQSVLGSGRSIRVPLDKLLGWVKRNGTATTSKAVGNALYRVGSDTVDAVVRSFLKS
jgi:hypothetical protein